MFADESLRKRYRNPFKDDTIIVVASGVGGENDAGYVRSALHFFNNI